MVGEDSGWITESVVGNYINNSIYCPVAGSSYMQLSRESGDLHKNNYNECIF